MKQKWMHKSIICGLFMIYLIVGIFLYKDYGISTDERDERESTFVNIKYALDTLGVDALDGANGDLEKYDYRYYGIAMQVVPSVLEWMKGFPGGEAYHIRHLWTFLVCFAGYICFYRTCRKTLRSVGLSLLGTAMVALYPRFFAEQFYNIKDMIFVAMVMISMYATVMVIESDYAVTWIIFFSIISALTTNVRIVGLLFPMLLVGYIIVEMLYQKMKRQTGWKSRKKRLRAFAILAAGFIFTYIICMPILWKHPIREVIRVFTKFSDYDQWNGIIVFMGQLLNKDQLPWYYIPVWVLISVPVWYHILFLLIVVTGIVCVVKKKCVVDMDIVFRHKYFIWAGLSALLPWLATVILHSTLYNGWRHFYFILPLFVYMIVYGMRYFLTKCIINKVWKVVIVFACIAGMVIQTGWIIRNHPYEMVYLNAACRKWGAEFDRDYWNLINMDLCRYILENDDSEKITVCTAGNIFMNFMTDEEKQRIQLVDISENPKYYIETYHGLLGNDVAVNGYQDYHDIEIDGYKIGTIFIRQSD